MRCAWMTNFFLLFTAVNALADVGLIIRMGSSRYDEDDRNSGISPPTEAELLEQAKQSVIENIDLSIYVQVSGWKVDHKRCQPIFRGSEQCYRGEAQVSASFIKKTDFEKDWWVRTDSISNARFFCNSDITLPAWDEESGSTCIENNCFPWYVANFNCDKGSPASR